MMQQSGIGYKLQSFVSSQLSCFFINCETICVREWLTGLLKQCANLKKLFKMQTFKMSNN